jgi:hypothetical protein
VDLRADTTKRVLVCGSRDWRDPTPIQHALAELQAAWGSFEVVDGGARGADTLARQIAQDLNLPVREFPADWERYGKAAGMIRNQKMLDDLLEADQRLVLAFPLPQSRGTRDMIRRAEKAGVETRVFAPNN